MAVGNSVLFSDDFNRADGSPGGNYTEEGTVAEPNNAVGPYEIATNQLQFAKTAGSGISSLLLTSGITYTNANYRVIATESTDGGNIQYGFWLRKTGSGASVSGYRVYRNNTSFVLERWVSGTPTELAASFVGIDIRNADWSIEVETVAATVEIRTTVVNGPTTAVNRTDVDSDAARITAIGNAGFNTAMGVGLTATWDDFSVEGDAPGSTGTLAATEQDDTLASIGFVGDGVVGTLAVTEADDTLAASGITGRATGDFQIDFSGLPDTNPYTNPNFTGIGVGGVDWQILSGVLKPASLDSVELFRYNNPATSGIIESKVQIDFSDAASGNEIGPGICNISASGYAVHITGGNVALRRLDSGFIGTTIQNIGTQSYSPGDIFSLRRDLSNNQLSVFLNDIQIGSTVADATYTTGLSQAVYSNPVGSNLHGAISFAADGILFSSGTLAVTEADDTLNSSGIVGAATAALAVTEDNDTSTANGIVGTFVLLNNPLAARQWGASLPVTINDERYNAGRVYTADSTGTTGTTAPIHGSGSVSDGTISWTFNRIAQSILDGFSGDAPVTGDRAVYDDLTDPDSISFSVDEQGFWTFNTQPTRNQTTDVTVIQANGTVGTTGTFTFIANNAGTVAVTEVNDILTATGQLVISGSLAQTEGDDALSSVGFIGDGVDGTLNVTEQDDSIAVTGALTIAGTLNLTEQDDTSQKAGTISIVGTVNVTEGDDTISASANLAIIGSVNTTELDDSIVGSGVAGILTSAITEVTGNKISITNIIGNIS